MTDSSDGGVARALAREGRYRDVALLSLVPAIAVGAFALPEPVRRSLAFKYVDPMPLTAVTATYVHLSAEHLIANLLAYGVVVGTGYALSVLAGRRRLFGTVAVTYVLVLGPLLWVLNLAVPRPAIGFGLSGVNMAFAGLLPIALAAFAGRQLRTGVGVRHAPLPFLLVVAVIALRAVPITPLSAGVAAGSAGLAALYGVSLTRSLRDRSAPAERGAGRWLETFVVGAVVTVGYPLVGFPSEPASSTGVVNLYVHFLGYGIAFIAPYVGVEAGLFE